MRCATQPDTLDDTARLLAEGVMPLAKAAHDAGLRPAPSLRTLLRACLSGRLESIKVAGRRLCSPAAIVRWISRSQQHRTPIAVAATTDAPAVLARYGLDRDSETPEAQA